MGRRSYFASTTRAIAYPGCETLFYNMPDGPEEGVATRWFIAGSVIDQLNGRLSYIIECRTSRSGTNWSAQVRHNGKQRDSFSGLITDAASEGEAFEDAVRGQVEALIRSRMEARSTRASASLRNSACVDP